MNDRRRAKRREEKGGEERLGLSGGERRNRPEGDQSGGADGPGGERRRRVTGELSRGRGDSGKRRRRRRRKRGADEGEFECARQTWTEASGGSWS